MAHHPRPWFRNSRRLWYVEIDGKQHNLGADRAQAFQRYHELMGRAPEQREVAADSVSGVFDAFLE
jgi:hypothetical protein